MPRKTRKQIVGKLENVERAQCEQDLRELARELHTCWWLGHSPGLELVAPQDAYQGGEVAVDTSPPLDRAS